MSAFEKRGYLAEFNTCLASNPNASWLKLLPTGVQHEWLRRSFQVPREKIYTVPFLEFSRLLLPKLGMKSYVRHEKGWASVDAVYQNFDKKVAKRLSMVQNTHELSAVYAYEDGALNTFIKAKELGLKCIYDLPIAYWETGRKLMKEEAERLPNWANTLGGGVLDSEAKLERKTRELELADVVVGPGSFVMDSIPDWAKNKEMIVSPFGSPSMGKSTESGMGNERTKLNRPLRILFVGSMGQRKGLGDLFAAFRLLNRNDVELVVMGSLLAPIEFYKREVNFTYEPGRPHEQVLELMRSCDIFCLPSIVEGRALVMQEAMSQGLPLIITSNTGGDDLIREGETGFLVPIRSPESIAEKVSWFLDNRSEIPQMGEMARKHAAQYTWDSYGARIVESLSQLTTGSETASTLNV